MHQRNVKHDLDALTSHDLRLATNLNHILVFVRGRGREIPI